MSLTTFPAPTETISSAPTEVAETTPQQPAVAHSAHGHAILLSVTVFLSAFLLFLMEPLFAKLILPWFGGSAAVWATCLVFFQCALLLGYLYADVTTRRLNTPRQVVLHIALLLLGLCFLPIAPRTLWYALGASHPAAHILV